MSTITLYNADCLDVLKTLETGSIDAVVTDPPYGISYTYGPSSRKGVCTTWKPPSKAIVGDDEPFDPKPWLFFPCVAFTGAQWFYDRLPRGGSLHCWDKRGEYRPLDQADSDMVWLSKPHTSRVFHLAWRGICRHSEAQKRFIHPTQKPVALMEWMIELLGMSPGSTILDPYMGSGTTGVAAAQMGMNFIGIEIDPHYFAIAEKRINAELNRHPLFEKPQKAQRAMFA